MIPGETSWTYADLHDALGVTKDRVYRLCRAGLVGYLNTRPRRFTAEHVAQIRACIEVAPRAAAIDLTDFEAIGATPRSARRRRSA